MTESGKTTLIKRMCPTWRANKEGVIVLDPMQDPGWDADFRTADNDEFLAVVWNSEKCHVIVDEAGDAIGRYDTTMQQLATKGRHYGHNCYFLTQRAAQVAFTIRAQCRHVFLFTSHIDDCKAVAKDFNADILLEGNSLPQGHFIHVSRYGEPQRGQLW